MNRYTVVAWLFVDAPNRMVAAKEGVSRLQRIEHDETLVVGVVDGEVEEINSKRGFNLFEVNSKTGRVERTQ